MQCDLCHTVSVTAGAMAALPPTLISPKLLRARIMTWPLIWALSLASANLRLYMAFTSENIADGSRSRPGLHDGFSGH